MAEIEIGEKRKAALPRRLPLQHPDYRYPPSRNPYSRKLGEHAGLAFWDNHTESRRGRWRQAFPERLRAGPSLELHVEIGCNAGHVIVEWAKRNPGRAYIGVDWKFKPIFRGVEKGLKHRLDNLIFFRANADRLRYIFGESEIDRISLFFPDPWPRKSQWKNRFVTPERLQDIHHALKPGGIFHVKTDHRGYFEWMEDAAERTGQLWEVVERTTDLHARHPAPASLEIPEVTLFEKLFIKDGIPINSLVLRARKS